LNIKKKGGEKNRRLRERERERKEKII